MYTKTEARRFVNSIKQELNDCSIHNNSITISNKVIETDEYNSAREIYIYISFNQEIDTSFIIQDAWKQSKKVAVPRIDNKVMNFYYIDSYQELKEGYYGIKEPISNRLAIPKGDLMIMPGLAFDVNGNRVGYGGGYYDRYLSNNTNVYKMAMAFDFQVLDEIVVDEYDVRVDRLITEKRMICVDN